MASRPLGLRPVRTCAASATTCWAGSPTPISTRSPGISPASCPDGWAPRRWRSGRRERLLLADGCEPHRPVLAHDVELVAGLQSELAPHARWEPQPTVRVDASS